MKPPDLESRFAFRKHMIINREFEQVLRDNGLDDFDTLMSLKDVEIVKQRIKERSTVRFAVPHGDGEITVYLKRYRYAMIPSFLKNCLSFSRTYSAIHEWRSILAFKASSLPTMTPIAVGMRRRFPFWNESFLLTLGIPHVKTLETIAQTDFTSLPVSVRKEQKNTLIQKLAALTRRMHEAGFKHQDFYLCHILVDWGNPADPLLFIADLHRVRKQKKKEGRWRIKDLAALNYSAPTAIVSNTDRLRFLTTYDPLLAQDRSFVRAILDKTGQIRRHTEEKGD